MLRGRCARCLSSREKIAARRLPAPPSLTACSLCAALQPVEQVSMEHGGTRPVTPVPRAVKADGSSKRFYKSAGVTQLEQNCPRTGAPPARERTVLNV
jgi:hypothetical protein